MSNDQLPEEFEHTDIEDLKKILRTWRMIQGWCRVNRWLAVAVIGVLIGIAQFGESVKTMLGWKVH